MISGNTRIVKDDQVSRYGWVEIFQYGEWTLVCAGGWNDVGASVVCREHNYLYGKTLPKGFFGRIDRYTYWNQVNCSGTEEFLANCTHETETCDNINTNYAAVVCSNDTLVKGEKKLLSVQITIK